jgi:hypothetical protein
MIQLNITNLIRSGTGRVIISVILGIGLATLFQTVCKNKNCITFNGPVISEVDGKIYEFADLCYKYELKTTHCDANKQIVDVKPTEVIGVGF